MRAPLCVRLKRANAHFRSHRNKYPRPEVENGRKRGRLRRILGPCRLINENRRRFGVYSASANVKFQGAYADKHFLTLSLNYTYSQYDFSSAAAPFSSANGASALAFYTARISERWGAFGIASASIGSETGASIWGGRTMLAGAGASYSFCESLTVGIGAMAYSRLDNTWLGLPVGFIDWENHRQAAPAHIFRRRAALRYFRGQFSYSKRRRRIQKLLLQAC